MVCALSLQRSRNFRIIVEVEDGINSGLHYHADLVFLVVGCGEVRVCLGELCTEGGDLGIAVVEFLIDAAKMLVTARGQHSSTFIVLELVPEAGREYRGMK